MATFNKAREEGRRRLQRARRYIWASIHGFCPVQAEFIFQHHGLYFRARHGHWGLAIAGPFGLHASHGVMHEAAIEVSCGLGPGVRYHGLDGWHGSMPTDEAVRAIIVCLRHWLGLRLTVPPGVVIDGGEVQR